MWFPSIRIELFWDGNECLKVLPFTHTFDLPPLKWSCPVTSLSAIYNKAATFPGTGARIQGEMSVWEVLNEVTIKKELLMPGVPSLGESCQGQCPGLGDLLILSGWCPNQEWLSKRFEWAENGIGQPASCSVCGFSCPYWFLPSCLPKREFLASFFTHSDCWTHSAAEFLGGRALRIWHSGRVPWMLSLSLPGLCCCCSFYPHMILFMHM